MERDLVTGVYSKLQEVINSWFEKAGEINE